MDRYQEVVDRTRCIRGHLIPVKIDDYVPGRPRCAGLAPDDYAKVRAGYACANSDCRAWWDDQQRDTCPLCLHTRTDADFQEINREWAEYEQYVDEQMANPERTETRPMHEMVDDLSRQHFGLWVPGQKRNL